MEKPTDRHLIVRALVIEFWKLQPKQFVLVNSDQGSQYGSVDYLAIVLENNLEPPLSRIENRHDNAVT